ncbi:MAG: BrxA/BrxB family bacilliredoxin [Acidobacteria bacterium]|nr:BrxA/BrxB family bacilliredoxin [Acidobacteriota bacterium]
MYDPRMIQPFRDDLTKVGFTELRSASDVDAALGKSEGTALVVVNSVCGCAAGQARPGVAQALARSAAKPDALLTVFAGQDTDATARARSYMKGYPPSSPSMALFKDGALVFMLERRQIEGRNAAQVAAALEEAFQAQCPAGISAVR